MLEYGAHRVLWVLWVFQICTCVRERVHKSTCPPHARAHVRVLLRPRLHPAPLRAAVWYEVRARCGPQQLEAAVQLQVLPLQAPPPGQPLVLKGRADMWQVRGGVWLCMRPGEAETVTCVCTYVVRAEQRASSNGPYAYRYVPCRGACAGHVCRLVLRPVRGAQ